MNAEQRKFLIGRLDAARRSKPRDYEDVKVKEPASVVAARKMQDRAAKVIDNWSDKLRDRREFRNKAISKAYNDARQAILFGKDTPTALDAVQYFEQMEF